MIIKILTEEPSVYVLAGLRVGFAGLQPCCTPVKSRQYFYAGLISLPFMSMPEPSFAQSGGSRPVMLRWYHPHDGAVFGQI